MTRNIAEYEATFERDPTSAEAFAVLRRHYEEEADLAKLVKVLERHAASVDDSRRAADLVWRASDMYRQMGDGDGELRSLNRAVALDPQHRQALERSCELARERGAWSMLLQRLERLKALVESRGERRRIAELEMQIAELWEERFFRWDKALEHYQLAQKAAPRDSAAIAASRRLLNVLGQWKEVSELYRAELENIHDNAARADLLLDLAGLAREKLGNLELAARALAEASSIRPGDESIMERLGELYASAEWPNPGGLDRAATVFMQIAQRRESRGDRDGAISYLRRALGADPENQAASARLERAYRDTGRWDDLDRLYRQRLGVAGETEAVALELKRAELLERHLGDRAAARGCYEALLRREPPGGTAEARLRELYHADGDYDALLALHKRTLDANVDRPTRIAALMEMAGIYRDALEDEAAAAALLHEVLQLDPTHRRALAAYERYFHAKGDYRNLGELIRFAAHAARERGAAAPDVCRLLEQWAEIAEEQLGDLPGALEAWGQIAELQRDPSAAHVQQRRIQDKMGHFQQVAHDLKVSVAEATSPTQRTRALLKMALVFTEQRIDPLRAIELLREVLQADPNDERALETLQSLYEREANTEGQVWAVERRLQGILKREERLDLLLKLAKLREEQQRLNDARLAYEQLLDLAPNDPQIYKHLQRLLEQADDWAGVCGLLERRAQVAESLADRIESRRKLAVVLEERLDAAERAIEQWEEVLQLADDDPEALEALSRLYERAQRPADQLGSLRRQLENASTAPIARRAQLLRQIASLAEALNLPEELLNAQETLNRLLPADRATLHALGHLYERLERHRDLVDVLERELDLEEEDDERLAIAIRQVNVLENELKDDDRAIACLERVVEQIAPGDLEAYQRLKALHRRCGNAQRACQIAEIQYVMFQRRGQKEALPALAREIAELWRADIADDHGAAVALERVLELAPDDADAITTLRTIYQRVGAHARLADLGEALLATGTDGAQRGALLFEQAELWERYLGDPARAFEWYERALFETNEEARALAQIERLASAHGLWEALVEVHETRLHAADPDERVAIAETVAALCRERLNDPQRAFATLREALDADPEGTRVLPALETLAREGDLGQQLHLVYGELARRCSRERRVALLQQQAKHAEEALGSPALALRSAIALFALMRGQDDQSAIVVEIERLAEASNQWDEALYVHLERLDRCDDDASRVQILRHLAQLLERKVGSAGRAFDALLHGLVIAPDDAALRDELWRLAARLAKHPPPDSAHRSFVPRVAPKPPAPTPTPKEEPKPLVVTSGQHRDDPTMDLDPAQLVEIVSAGQPASGPGANPLVVESTKPHRDDPTLELDASQVVEIVASGTHRDDATMDLDASQVIEVLAADRSTAETSTPSVEAPPPAPTSRPQAPPAPPPILVSLAWLPLHPVAEGTPWERIAQTLRRMSAAAERPVKIARLLLEAEMWADAAKDVRAAFASLTEAAALAPTEAEARHRIEQLAAEHGAYEELFTAYEELIEHCADRDTLVMLHHRCAELRIERGEQDQALRHLQAILAVQPDHEPAFDALNAIYRERGSFDDLATLLERQLSAIGRRLAPETRQQRLMELADLHQHELDHPHEAATFLGRLLEERSNNPGILGRLADLYQDLSLWPQLVDVLQSLLAATSQPEHRAPILVRLGRVFERELELPHRAIEAYKQAVEASHGAKEALEALEQLYRAHKKEDELAGVLAKGAEMAEDAIEAARWRLRLSEVLERSAHFLRAAEALEGARGAAPDGELDDRIATLLVASGNPDLAVEKLRARVDEARRAGAPAEAVADTLVRLSRLLGDQLVDFPRAEEAVREAVTMAPTHLAAQQQLAQLQAQQGHWDAFAETTTAIAELLEEREALQDHLLRSATLLRDHGAKERAISLFEQALQRDPDSLGAIDGLLGLVDDPARRLKMLEHKRGLVKDAAARAQVLVALAREQQRNGVSADAVLGSYRRAIELAPTALEPRDALSALLIDEGREDEAQRLLEQSIEMLKDTPRANELGRLYYRLGSLFEKTKGDEEGYAFLRAAHRLQPKDLLLRLAIGKNRFRARRWREAMRHLREAMDHPDRESFAELSADALYHAGLCALELRRPADAQPFFEAAQRLDPRHGANLRALASLLRETDTARAALHLEQLAEITANAKERTALWVELAQLYKDELDRPARAADVYERVLVDLQAKPGETVERQRALLLEMLPILDSEGRHEPAAVAASALAALVDEVEARRDFLIAAATHHEASKSWQRADTCYKQALHLDSECCEAALGLALSFEAQGRPSDAAALLAGHLAALPRAPDADARATRAQLYATKGRIHRALGETDDAIEAFERQLDLADDESVRALLVELYADNPRRTAAALANHRVLAKNIDNVDSLRAIAAASSGSSPYRAHAIYRTLEAMGRLSDQGRAFLAGYAPPKLEADAHFEGEINSADREALLSAPGANALREVFTTLWEAAPLLLDRKIEDFGLTNDDRISPVDRSDVAKVYTSTARALRLKATGLYRRQESSPSDGIHVQVAGMARPAIIVPATLGPKVDLATLRFVIARALELAQPSYIFAAGMERAEFARLLTAVVRAFHPRYIRKKGLPGAARDEAERFRQIIPYKVARRLGEFFRAQPELHFDSGAWRLSALMSANRVGLAICGDLAAALTQIRAEEPELAELDVYPQGSARSPLIKDLLTFAASEAYYVARVKLGMAGGG